MLSRPDFMKSSRTMQQLFINGRPVEYRYLGYLLSRAYEAVAQHGKYPVAMLFLDIDPTLVDVNIHPAKREVKLFDSRYIDSLILQLAGKALNRIHSMSDGRITPVENSVESEVPEFRNAFLPGLSGNEIAARRDSFIPREASANGELHSETAPSSVREMAELYTEMVAQRDYSVLGVAFNTYILVQKQDQLYFIDFHAAHERFIYDSLVAAQSRPEKQELMFPVMMELPVDEFHVILDNAELFSEIGFDIEEFSDNTITIRSVPALVGRLNEKEFIREVVDSIKQERQVAGRQKVIAASAACHSAKRAGDSLSSSDISGIVDRVFSGEHELRCPHGRPFAHVIKKEDLERIFKR